MNLFRTAVRAGGNPAKLIFRAANNTLILNCFTELFIYWIPACAGMTGFSVYWKVSVNSASNPQYRT